MSGDWIFYPCQMGDHRASIFFDHGIKESIDGTAPRFLLQARIVLQQPRADGMSSQEEFKQLCALEDDLEQVVAQHGALYVGRVTMKGERRWNIFTDDLEAEWEARLRQVGGRHGYEFSTAHRVDEAREGYWKDLFPRAADWQVIKDMRVLEVLSKEGDDGSASRAVDHWAFFPTQAAADAFAQWVQSRGHVVQGTTMEEERVEVRFAHESTLQLSVITSHTIALMRKAAELGGDYDGWETVVCR